MVSADLFEKILVYLVQKPSYDYYIEEVRKNRGMNFKTKESKAKPTSVACLCIFLWCLYMRVCHVHSKGWLRADHLGGQCPSRSAQFS